MKRRGLIGWLLRDRRGGTASLEFVFIAAVYAPLTFAILEIGFILWTQNSMQSAATLGAPCAAIGSADCPDVASYTSSAVGEWLVPDTVPSTDVSVTSSTACNGAPGTATVVTITHQFWSGITLPWPFNAPSISVSACFPSST